MECFMSDNNSNRRINPEDFKLNIQEDDLDMVPLDDFSTGSMTGDIRDEGRTDYYSTDIQQKELKKEHKKRDKLKSHKNKRVFKLVWLAMVILVALSLASYLIEGSNDFFAIGRNEGEATVEVPANVTVEQLTESLYKAKVINNPEFFKLYCMIRNKDWFEPGTYSVPTNMDYEGLISFLQEGQDNQTEVEITFQEGMNVMEIAQRFEDMGVATAEEILEAAKTSNYDNYDMISEITNTSDRYYKLEGYLFPDTYKFYTNEDINSVIGKMLNNFQTRITSDIMEDIEDSDYSIDQIMTLASIIQLEAANREDMFMISAILHNRLENGEDREIYTLGCDSTMFYPYRTAEDAPAGYKSNYDTYEISGLPAGPICNPGLDAIKAALKPSDEGSDYYYFCHDAEGNAYYASTSDEHNANLEAAGLLD